MVRVINDWIDRRLRERDRAFMDATVRRAATEAIHYYTSVRSTDEWRKILDTADASGKRYVSMAELIITSGFKR